MSNPECALLNFLGKWSKAHHKCICFRSQKQQSQSPGQKLIVEELAKEASLMAKLRHPNIVMFLGAALDPPCMVTEFCARGSLLDVLHRARTNEVKFSSKEDCQIFSLIFCEAI